jgi:hypothetical protein
MKKYHTHVLTGLVAAMLAGCCTDDVYIPKIPMTVKGKIMDYDALSHEKVFVIAIDPSGEYAFGYDHGKDSVKEAERMARLKCEVQKKKVGVHSPVYVYAVNDRVVFEESIRAEAGR